MTDKQDGPNVRIAKTKIKDQWHLFFVGGPFEDEEAAETAIETMVVLLEAHGGFGKMYRGPTNT